MMMKRLSLVSAFALACVFGAACSSEADVTCEVVWTANDVEVGSATLVYEGLDDVDLGLEMCLEDQVTHEDRPTTAMMHVCNCST